MEIGIQLSSETPQGKPLGEQINEMITHTRIADEAGFDWVGMGQHYLLDNPKPQTVPMLARVAAETDSMGVYTGILLLPLHHPVEIAEQFTTLSYLADNVGLGVGVGYIDREFDNFGIDKSSRVPRFTESLDIITGLWSGEPVTYNGEYYSVTDAELTATPSSPPLVWCGGQAEPAIKRAARIGDAWFPGPSLGLDELKDLKATYDSIRADDASDTAIPLFREAYVAPTTEEAYDIARDALQSKYASYIERNPTDPDNRFSGDATNDPAAFQAYAEDRFLIGSPEKVRDDIEKFDQALNLSHVMLRVRRPGQSSEDTIDCIELIGEELIPALPSQ